MTARRAAASADGICRAVERSILEGDWNHDHLAECPQCRALADSLAAVESDLRRGSDADRAPDTLMPVVRRRLLAESLERDDRWLLAAAGLCVAAGIAAAVVVARLGGGIEVPGLAAATLAPGEWLQAARASVTAAAATVPLTALLYALAGAGLVRLLAAAD